MCSLCVAARRVCIAKTGKLPHNLEVGRKNGVPNGPQTQQLAAFHPDWLKTIGSTATSGPTVRIPAPARSFGAIKRWKCSTVRAARRCSGRRHLSTWTAATSGPWCALVAATGTGTLAHHACAVLCTRIRSSRNPTAHQLFAPSRIALCSCRLAQLAYAYDPSTGKELWKVEYGGLGLHSCRDSATA